MTAHTEIPPGAARVGSLTAIPAWEAEFILSFRFWMHGPEGQAQVWSSFARCFGAREGKSHMRLFEGMLGCLCTYSRRPLVCHGPECACIGSDEAVVLTLVREAARGDIAEAALIASLMVPAGQAELVALKAAEVGQSMRRMTSHIPPGPVRPAQTVPRLH